MTGFFDLSEILREKNAKDLPIDRVYEHGEILAYVRYALKNAFPPRPCDPQVRLVRFNVLEGRVVAQHNMARLTEKLLEWKAAPPRALQFLPVRNTRGPCGCGLRGDGRADEAVSNVAFDRSACDSRAETR